MITNNYNCKPVLYYYTVDFIIVIEDKLWSPERLKITEVIHI